MSDALTEYRNLEPRVLAALREDLSEAAFGALALEIHEFQRRWNEPYGKFCATKPKPKTWREIAAVPQSAFKRYRLCIAPPTAIAKTFRTSGTTGEGFGEHHFVDTRLYEAAIVAGWNRLGQPESFYLSLVAEPRIAPHSSLSHMIQTLSTRPKFLVSSDGRIGFQKLRDLVSASSNPPQTVALLGTALAFLRLFEMCREAGVTLTLPRHSYAMETGGYKGSGREIPKAELYGMFGEFLGLAPEDVINEYGMTELSSQFYTRGLGQPHEGGPWVRAIVINPETGGEVEVGETGVLRIFDLANLGSVLAIETQDLAIRRERGFELIGRDPGALPRGCSRAADERMRA